MSKYSYDYYDLPIAYKLFIKNDENILAYFGTIEHKGQVFINANGNVNLN